VSFHAAQTLQILPKEGSAPIDVDGEAVGFLPLRAEVLPGAIEVFAPGHGSAPSRGSSAGGKN
jgi:diacylglycerol kinase family enzyme